MAKVSLKVCPPIFAVVYKLLDKGIFDGGCISGDCIIPSSEQAAKSFLLDNDDDVIARKKFASSIQYIAGSFPGLLTVQFMITYSCK